MNNLPRQRVHVKMGAGHVKKRSHLPSSCPIGASAVEYFATSIDRLKHTTAILTTRWKAAIALKRQILWCVQTRLIAYKFKH